MTTRCSARPFRCFLLDPHLKVVPNYSIQNAPKPDIVIFPGGHSSNLTNDPEFFAWAKKAAAEAEIAQSVCTGAFVLGKAGMLDNLEVTTWYGQINALQKSFPKARVKDGRRFVDNGKVVTTAGISAGIDGSIHIVARLLGRRVADQVARYMEYHWTPEAYLVSGYQYLNPSTDDRGRLMQSADMLRDEKNYTEAVNIYRAVLKQDDSNANAWSALARALHEANDHLLAAEAFVKAAELADEPGKARALYNAACEYALADRVDPSIDLLKKAYAAGVEDRDAVNRDPDLAKLRNDPRIKELVVAAR